MPMDRDAFNRWLRLNAQRVQVAAVAIVVLGASVWIGKQSRAHLAPLEKQISDLRAAANELARWRAGFRAPDAREATMLGDDSVAVRSVAVPTGSRMLVAQAVARQAEQAGLTGVRLSFVPPPDSATVPVRGRVGNIPITVAKYAVSLDCSGSFAAALAFVDHLPPTLAMSTLGVVTQTDGVRYHLVLSVYEVPNGGG
ncbi:MAG TPA: hypothetical protein VMH39_16185 [Gemmatimonadaceae bacterium]|nr:hypothetical protein [Gemmatimonadaceae bacterium]